MHMELLEPLVPQVNYLPYSHLHHSLVSPLEMCL